MLITYQITQEVKLNNFKAWSRAVSTLDKVRAEGKCEELESILEDLYPNGMTEIELNDLLRFEFEQIYEWLGLRTEEQIQAEIDEVQTQLDRISEDMKQLTIDWAKECKYLTEKERAELWQNNYKDTWDELKNEDEELKETIADLKEECATL